MPSNSEIIDLIDVVEEGHPDRPNLQQAASSPSSEGLEDLDLEKEIDQIFADLGEPSSVDGQFGKSSDGPGGELNLDDLFDSPDPAEPSAVVSQTDMSEVLQPDMPADEAALEQPVMDVPVPVADLTMDEAKGDDLDIPDIALDLVTEEEPAPTVLDQGSSQAEEHLPLLLERLSAVEEKVSQSENLDQMISERLEARLASFAEEFSSRQEEQVIALVGEKNSKLDGLDQMISERLEARIASFAEESSTRQEEQMASLRQELQPELEQNFKQIIQNAIDEASAQNQGALTQGLAMQKEEIVALVHSHIQDALQSGQRDQAALQEQMLSEVQVRTTEALQPLLDAMRSELEAAKTRLDEYSTVQEALQAKTHAAQKQWGEFQEQAEAAAQGNAATLNTRLEQVRTDLLQEVLEAIPGAAARIIREEIQALSQDER